MTTIASEIQKLAPSAIVELFEIDLRPIGLNQSIYMHAGTNKLSQPVVWQGVQYQPWPVECEGFDLNTKGTLPRPKIRAANIGGALSAEAIQHDDLIGAKVIRRRTFASALDAVNFPGGVNPSADPNVKFQDDIWYFERKTSESFRLIEWELSSAFDVQGVQLPFRQLIQNTCTWTYKSQECGYSGAIYLDANDQPCAQAQDTCGKRLASCRGRFVNQVSTAGGVVTVDAATLPFGGFPGAVRHG